MNSRKTRYDEDSPALTEHSIQHSHARTINYAAYGLFGVDASREYSSRYTRAHLRQKIDQEKTQIMGCMTFFKTLAESEKDPATKALAAAAAAEDEALLKEHNKHRPLRCIIM